MMITFTVSCNVGLFQNCSSEFTNEHTRVRRDGLSRPFIFL